MYGLVNKAVVDLVVNKFGEDTWVAIKKKAGVDHDLFVSMDAYPDDITYRLVGAASEVLGIPPAAVLEAFGEWWVLYTGRCSTRRASRCASSSRTSTPCMRASR